MFAGRMFEIPGVNDLGILFVYVYVISSLFYGRCLEFFKECFILLYNDENTFSEPYVNSLISYFYLPRAMRLVLEVITLAIEPWCSANIITNIRYWMNVVTWLNTYTGSFCRVVV